MNSNAIAAPTNDVWLAMKTMNLLNSSPSTEKLLLGMEFHQRYRDIAFIFIVGTYVLNIIEANVSAHLLQFNVNDQLSFQPKFNRDFIRQQNNFGLSVNLKF